MDDESYRERKTSTQVLGMSNLAGQQEATQDLFTVSRVGATGETAEVAAEVAEAGGPEAELALVVGLPEPPELAAELAALRPGQRRGERFQIPKPRSQTELVGGAGIDDGRCLQNCRGIVTDDPLDLLQAALPEASEQLDLAACV